MVFINSASSILDTTLLLHQYRALPITLVSLGLEDPNEKSTPTQSIWVVIGLIVEEVYKY